MLLLILEVPTDTTIIMFLPTGLSCFAIGHGERERRTWSSLAITISEHEVPEDRETTRVSMGSTTWKKGM